MSHLHIYLSMIARGHKGHKDLQTTILKCHFWKKMIKNMKVWGWKYEMYGAVLRSACSSKRGDGGRQFRGKTQQIAASARCCLGCQVGCLGFGGQACCLGFGGQASCLGFGSVEWVGWQFEHFECQSDRFLQSNKFLRRRGKALVFRRVCICEVF